MVSPGGEAISFDRGTPVIPHPSTLNPEPEPRDPKTDTPNQKPKAETRKQDYDAALEGLVGLDAPLLYPPTYLLAYLPLYPLTFPPTFSSSYLFLPTYLPR